MLLCGCAATVSPAVAPASSAQALPQTRPQAGAPNAAPVDGNAVASAGNAAAGPRLLQEGDLLYVADAPAAAVRGALLYVHSNKPLPRTSVFPPIAIAKATNAHDGLLEVSWYCRPDASFDLESALHSSGLPVSPIPQDTLVRVSRCITTYRAGSDSDWNSNRDWLDLQIDLGKGDGLHAGDRYEVLGEARVDAVNRVVSEFRKDGACRVQEDDLQTTSAICRVDRGAKSFRMTREEFLRGGFVLLAEDPQGSRGR
jgi:hypothetical protein